MESPGMKALADTRPDWLYGPVENERQQISREEFLAAVLGEINPEKYAGEGWFSTEEYATPGDVADPWIRAEIGREGDYYPGKVRPENERDALMKLLRRM